MSDPAIATPDIGSFITPCTPQPFYSNSDISSSFSSKLDSLEAKLCDKIMAIKSFFMDEFHTIKSDSLTSAKVRNASTNIDYGTVDILQTKIKLLETENKLLKGDIKNKQKLINSILEHNSNLIQAQNVFAQKHSVNGKANDKSISHTTGNNAFWNDKKNELNVPKDDRFKEPHVNFKDFHPEAHQPKVKKNIVIWDSTEDLIEHIKLAIRKTPDIVIVHTGTNALQNNCNIVKKAKRLVSAVEEAD